VTLWIHLGSSKFARSSYVTSLHPDHIFEYEELCHAPAPRYGLELEGKKRWCAGCEAVEGAVSLQMRKMCEGCGLKQPRYGLASEGKPR
jgi:hypothetical protein